MELNLITSNSPYFNCVIPSRKSIPHLFSFPIPSNPPPNYSLFLIHHRRHSSEPSRFIPICFSNPVRQSDSTREIMPDSNSKLGAGNSNHIIGEDEFVDSLNVQLGNPVVPSFFKFSTKLGLSDQAFLLLSFIACTTSIAFTSLIIAAVPTLFAMRRAAISLSKLADTAREELPSTMAAIRLSGMEISDLTLELSDLSQEIADGVNKSAQAVQAAEAGIRQMGSLAHHHTVSMIQERASLPIISLRPVVTGAAKKTSKAVGQAAKTLMNMISGRENEDDRVEI